MQAREALNLYVESYFERWEGKAYSELSASPDYDPRCLAFGAAGVAFSHWYAGMLLRKPRLLRRARSWIREALEGPGRGPDSRREDRVSRSLLYGHAGILLVQALVESSLGDARALRRALDRYVRFCAEEGEEGRELYKGRAGHLVGAAILLRFLGDETLRRPGDALARGLLAAAPGGGDGEGEGLAHGAAGVDLALILWALASGMELPSGFLHGFEDFLEGVSEDREGTIHDPRFAPRLCSGLTGLAFAASVGARLPGATRLRRLGAELLRSPLSRPPATADLCCGRAGLAAACLAVGRLDPEGPWRTRAEQLVLSTLLCEEEDWVTPGLYGGEAAIPCLAIQLLLDLPGGPPLLDVLQIPEGPGLAPATDREGV